MKFKIHSSVDLITNSSTVIFTYSEGSLKELENLVNEMLITFDKPELKFDDLFYAAVLPDEYDERPDNYKELEIQYIKGEIEMQPWMESVENYDGFYPDSTLHIIPKDEKYQNLANQLLKYLYSTDHEATRDG